MNSLLGVYNNKMGIFVRVSQSFEASHAFNATLTTPVNEVLSCQNLPHKLMDPHQKGSELTKDWFASWKPAHGIRASECELNK